MLRISSFGFQICGLGIRVRIASPDLVDESHDSVQQQRQFWVQGLGVGIHGAGFRIVG